MKEPKSNIRCFCREYASKPINYQGTMLSLVGKFVKKGFPAERASREHMWVLVSGVKNGELVGTLDNEPAYTDKLKLGDTVTVQRDEIGAVV